MLPQKRVVVNEAQRIPNLAKLPFVDATNPAKISPALMGLANNLHLVETTTTRGEVYYLRQNAPTSRQKPSSG